MKKWLPRLVEALSVEPMKEDIFAAGTKYQNGGCLGKRTDFHLFVVKSNIDLKLYEGDGVIWTLLNLIKFLTNIYSFFYACNALYQAKVNPNFYSVWYTLNASTEILY